MVKHTLGVLLIKVLFHMHFEWQDKLILLWPENHCHFTVTEEVIFPS